MNFTGVWINSLGVVLAGILGSVLKKGISERVKDTMMVGLSLCVLYNGISGIPADADLIVVIVSVSIGAFFGATWDLDRKLNRLGELLQEKLPLKDEQLVDAFVSSTLFVCVGAMSIVGGIESGTRGTYDTFLAKTFIDGFVVFVMATSKGIGCCLSAIVALVYQAVLTLSAGYLALVVTEQVLDQMSQIGALLIVAIGLNLLNITKIKAANLILSPFIPPVLYVGKTALEALF